LIFDLDSGVLDRFVDVVVAQADPTKLIQLDSGSMNKVYKGIKEEVL